MKYTRMTLRHDYYPKKRFEQVSKAKAKKLYNEGQPIFFHSCNMRFSNPWQAPMEVRKEWSDGSFDTKVYNYEYYNCDKYRGKYANFFIEKDYGNQD